MNLLRWMNYEEADTIASNVGRVSCHYAVIQAVTAVMQGLRVLGQEANKPLCLFADTRGE